MLLSVGVRVTFALLVLATVGLKVALNTSISAASDDAVQERSRRLVERFLVERGYRLVDAEGPVGSPFVTGVSGACRTTAVIAAADGWLSDSLARMAGPGDRILYAYEGRIYAEQPVWLTWFEERRRRLARFVGSVRAAAPVVGVLEREGCSDERLWLGFGVPPDGPGADQER